MERLSTRSHLGGAGRAVVTSKRMLGMLQLVVVVALMTTVVVVGVMGDDSETVDVKIPRLIRRTLRKQLGDTPDQNGSGWTGRQREDLKDLAKKARDADKLYRIAAPIFLASVAGGLAANYKARHADAFGSGRTGWNALALATLVALGASGATAVKAAIDRVKVEKKFKQLAKVVRQYREQEAAAAATAAAAEEAAEDASMADEAKPTSDDVAPQEAVLPEEVMTAAEYAAEALSGAEK